MNCLVSIMRSKVKPFLISFAAALLIISGLSGAFAETAAQSASAKDMQRQGEKIYREGVLPSGKPLQTFVKGETQVPGTTFTCVSCHLLSGLGAVEGGVLTTPINGRSLYQARDLPGAGNNRRNTGMSMASKKKGIPAVQPAPARPAYSDETLAEAIRGGKDPAGRALDPVMPRYELNGSDMAILIAYLKELSAEYSPGVDNNFIKFATVIAEGVPPEQVAAMMEPLESFAKGANKQQEAFEAQQIKLRENPRDATYRRVKVSRWLLKGSPDTWRGQLEKYYRQEPVFALLAGISPDEWHPVHEFSETHKIPCILPSTEFPVVSQPNAYTLYFSKGYFQEGEAAAHYLLSQDNPLHGKRIVQIVANSRQGKTLAEGFTRTLESQGQPKPVTFQQTDSDSLDAEFVRRIIERENPELLVLWTNADVLQHVATIPVKKTVQTKIIVSAGYLGKDLRSIPEQLRDSTYITYPYRLPQDEARYERFLKPADKNEKLTEDLRIVKSRTYLALRVLTQAMREMNGDFYRDQLFDVIGMQPNIEFLLYEQLSFGPDQRYASKGCYMVQLTKDSQPQLVKKSEWVIQ